MSIIIKVAFFALLVASKALAWQTVYDQHFKIECPDGQMIKRIESIHDNHKEDRVFNIGCSVPPSETKLGACEWSGYVNAYDALLEFQCHNDKVVAGIESIHDNGKEDRQFGFKCCEPSLGYVTHSCEFTGYANQYDGALNYRVPDGWIMKGVTSVHDNRKEDRIFKFDICKYDALSGGETIG